MLLHQEPKLYGRLLRDRVIVEGAQVLAEDFAYADVREKALEHPIAMDYLDAFKLYAEKTPLLEAYGIDVLLREMNAHSVEIEGGGELIIDRTEALVAIDVNSAGLARGKRFAETAFELNKRAAREAARQIRLRNLSGIIIVDFVNMMNKAHRLRIDELFAAELAKDPVPHRLLPLDEFGLAKLTRKQQ
jgi:Rne/Rng family ribonuclease